MMPKLTVKTLRCAGESEIYSLGFFKQIGIVHETLVFYTWYKKNGINERKNKTFEA